jgi:hypothetical protein
MSYLQEQNLLLILDNFERLIVSSDLVANLLQQAPQLTILVTSQARLKLRAEWLFDVVGLAYPPVEQPGFQPYSTRKMLLAALRCNCLFSGLLRFSRHLHHQTPP